MKDRKTNVLKFSRLVFSEKCLFLLHFLILVPGFLKLLMGVNARFGLSMINPFLAASLYVILYILSFKSFKDNIRWWDFLVVIILGVLCYLSPQIYPETSIAVLEFGPSFVFGALPFYIIGTSLNITKHDAYLETIGRIGVIINIIIALLSLLGLTNSFNVSEESMGIAYNTLPSVILVLRNQIMRPNIMDLTLTILGAFLLMSLGSRGPIIALALFWVGSLFIQNSKSYSVTSRPLLIICTVILIVFLEPIMLLMASLAETFGFGTRVYEAINGGAAVSSYNRDWIYDIVDDYIRFDNSNIGYGLFYDRVIMGMEPSSYCHNLFYEVCLDFGIYIGGALLILLFGVILFNIFKYRRTSGSSLYFALFCSCVVQLFFSLSYLISILFWYFIGITVSSIRRKNIKNQLIAYKNDIV